jgi:hypothetical protein
MRQGRTTTKKNRHGNFKGKFLIAILLLGLFAYLLGISFFAYSWSPGPNYRNVTVDTKVNITGSIPFIDKVTIENPITLSAGSMTTITCNISVGDYNGFGDISTVNATLFHSTSTIDAADNNNTHYTNQSCTIISGQASGIYANYTCSFPVRYYALNGTWNCTSWVNDSINLRVNRGNLTNVSPLYALNISPILVDYGQLSAGDYSNNITVNVTNMGNLNINISTFGYARTFLDNLSFVCDQGNYTIDLQHFSANPSHNFSAKQNLSSSYKTITSLTVNKTNNDTTSLNATYWEFYADPTQIAFGNCTGFLVFQADAAQ